MGFRLPLACVAGALLFACTVVGTSEIRTADTANDSDDYSSWFAGLTAPDIDDFEAQDDADQAAYPTDEPEPDHEPEPTEVARVAGGRGDRAASIDPLGTPQAFEAGSDAGSSGSDAGSDAGGGSGSGSGSACGANTYSASRTLPFTFNVTSADHFLGSFGPVRQHRIWARGGGSGMGSLTLAGTLTTGTNSWSATISVSGTASATAWFHADQELGALRRWFAVGDATASGNITFADSVTFTMSCPSGVMVTSPGTPVLGVNVQIDDGTFYGYFFPRLHGPVITAIRGAIAQFARNFLNRRLAGLVQSQVFTFNQAYAAKKTEVLNALRAQLPQGCGCP